jgi:tetratricopeptide (TPR) repeat protein
MRKRYRNLLVSLFALLLASGCASVSAQSKNENPFFVFEQSRKLLREHAEQLKRQTNATPDNLDTQLNLGRTLFLLALEQDDEARQQAETFFNKLLEQNPDNAVALAYRGSLLGLKIGSQAVPENETVQLGQQSLFDLDRAVKLSPDSIEVRQIRGYANFFMPASAGRESIAIEDFNHLIALLAQSPDTKHQRAKIYLILGDVHRKRNDQSNARANWQRAIEIAPETATAETAKSRLSNQGKQKETDETNLIDLVAFFGFSIGTLLFGLLTVLITRDVIRLRRRRAMFLSLTVSGILLIWNAASLTFVIAQALGNEKAKPLIAWTQNPFLLALAFAPIPFGLLAAWRLYKATFMDIVIKRGAAVLAILVFAFLYTQLIEAQLFWTLLRVSNPTLRSFFFASVWVGFLLSFPTLRNWIYLMIDRHLFKRRDYARVLDKFNEKLRSVTDEQSLLATSEDYLQKAFYAESVRFVEASDELKAKLSTAADIVLRQQVKDESLETEFAKHRAELLLIIREPEGASGFFLFGQRAYGQGYLSEELSVLRAVARQISQAIENLRLHEAKRQHAIAEEELRKLVSQAELKALRAQIDPHFFFNSLNSVAALIHRSSRLNYFGRCSEFPTRLCVHFFSPASGSASCCRFRLYAIGFI